MTPLSVWWTLLPLTVPAPPPGGPADRGEEFGKTSPIALVVILLLGLATVLLIRSMSKRLRNVPESFDPPADSTADADPATDHAAGPAGDRVQAPGTPSARPGVDRTDAPPGAGSP
jgi:hypothetical protein